jgi:hypothetical protein
MVMPVDYLNETDQVTLTFVSGSVIAAVGMLPMAVPETEPSRARIAFTGHQEIRQYLDGWARLPDGHEHPRLLDEPND